MLLDLVPPTLLARAKWNTENVGRRLELGKSVRFVKCWFMHWVDYLPLIVRLNFCHARPRHRTRNAAEGPMPAPDIPLRVYPELEELL